MEKKELKFQKLTPINDIELGVYKDGMDYIFENKDIRNIAITGAYSSGKSSVLESYKNKANLQFIRISLAHFCSFNEGTDRIMTEAIVEGKIINQLIHHLDSDKIQQTGFKIKREVNNRTILVESLIILLFVISFSHYHFFDVWRMYILNLPPLINPIYQYFNIQDFFTLTLGIINYILKFTINPYTKLISGVILIVLGGRLLYLIINALKNDNFLKKIKFQTYEIEVFDKKEESYFDKYLNDVIYLFENVDSKVIVFEDIDRFEVHGIFERLREINTLVNIRLEKSGEDPLRFFYLLRDDIFQSKERTKFFDYIMPIVPVMDSSNSYDELIKHFEKGEIINLFEKRFLQDISLYIDDMRLLKNIYNEFLIYYFKLNITELNPNKMLAMIVYKNLFPQDFSELQLNKGLVFALFDKKNDFIQSEVNHLENKILEINNDIDMAKKECLESLRELDVVYKDKCPTDFYGNRKALSSEDQNHYEERKKVINIKLNNQIPVLEEKITELQKQKLEIQHKVLSQLITRENEEEIFSINVINEIGKIIDFNSVKGNDYFSLLKYLIRNGYIDETYADYMTYFNGESIGRQDKVFLRSITDRKSKDYTYVLNDKQKIIDRLRLVDFDQEEILNFDLLEHLLITPENTKYLDRFLLQLKRTNNLKFIKLFMESQKETLLFVKNLNLVWPDLFSNMLKENQLPFKIIKMYSLYTICYLDHESLEAVNKDNILGDYISNCKDYLNVENCDFEKLIDGLKFLNVSFKGIDYVTANKDLFNLVYENSLYEINFNHLKLILEKVYKIKGTDDIYGRNYTSILSQPNSPLAKYIKQNMNSYIECILSNIEGTISDDESKIMMILNDESIESHNKQKYIECLKTEIELIENVIDNSLWTLLIEKNLIQYSEENIVDYFSYAESMDDCLINWINRNKPTLDFSKIKERYEEDVYDQFFDSFIISNEIINSNYKALVSTFRLPFEQFNVDGISGDKLMILIDEEIVIMNLDTLEYLRAFYPNQVTYFIKKNLSSYVDLIDSRSFSMNELLNILLWNVEDDIKLKLLKNTDESISIIHRKYCDAINKHILTNNLMKSDLEVLFKEYDTWSNSIQSIIFSYASKRIEEIIKHINCISEDLIIDLFYSDKIEHSEKIDIFIELLPKLDRDTCRRYSAILNLVEYVRIFEPRKRPKIEINSINNKLLTAFKNNNLINGFEEKNGFYRISKKKIA